MVRCAARQHTLQKKDFENLIICVYTVALRRGELESKSPFLRGI
ncbi:hypothetical protein NSP_50380 [Nodularia spumigena CCY9414]|nr:hypothetical protein NSP_50380 [Nodularia spumigena CCY9414]